MLSEKDFIKAEGKFFPGRTYVDELLKHVFYDQRDYLFKAMFSLSKAHVVMLEENGLLTHNETKRILLGFEELEKMDHKSLQYSPEYEDLFFMIEARLSDLIGLELAGKVHIARSRNDMGEGMYRLVIREHLLSLISDLDNLSEALLEKAEAYRHAVMPAHTHTQPAQPTTFGHYLLAIYDTLQRDRDRLIQAFHTVNHSPLGAVAITTTGFPISRERLAELLGFKELIENSYDAIATGDYLMESAQAIISTMVNMGRWIQEFLRFSSHEVGLIKVAAPYVQISSVMPQKRNPVSIEHSRSLASNSAGEAMTVIQMLHNTPYGDINDTEDDMQPTLYSSFQKASRVMRIMYAVVRTMDFNIKHAAEQAGKNLITITEFADVLTRDHGISFRKAHGIAAKVAQLSTETGKELYEWTAKDINDFVGEIELTDEEWKGIVDPVIFVERRAVRGGPNPNEVKRMIETRTVSIKEKINLSNDIRKQLDQANNLLKDRIKELTR